MAKKYAMAWETGKMIWYGLKDMENNMVWLERHGEKVQYGLGDMGK